MDMEYADGSTTENENHNASQFSQSRSDPSGLVEGPFSHFHDTTPLGSTSEANYNDNERHLTDTVAAHPDPLALSIDVPGDLPSPPHRAALSIGNLTYHTGSENLTTDLGPVIVDSDTQSVTAFGDVDDADTDSNDQYYSVAASRNSTPIDSPQTRSIVISENATVSLDGHLTIDHPRLHIEDLVVDLPPSPNNHPKTLIDDQMLTSTVNLDESASTPLFTTLSSSTETASSNDLDLLCRITGMYRLLDLILERGNDGLVHKVVIAQESLGELINVLRPGAYHSLTKIDFKALDHTSIKPVGVYGSKPEIVKLLLSAGAITEQIGHLLLKAHNDYSEPMHSHLRSGLYFVILRESFEDGFNAFVVYWPEETTWEDGASSSVSKNRCTFMRYLLKLVDQTIAVLTTEQSKAFKWTVSDQVIETEDKKLDDDFGRIISFEVAQTRDEVEGVSSIDGFQMTLPIPSSDVAIPDHLSVYRGFKASTSIVAGETSCGFMTSSYIQAHENRMAYAEVMNEMRLKKFLNDHAISISFPEFIDDAALTFLLHNGLQQRCPGICPQFEHNRQEIKQAREHAIDQERSKLSHSSEAFRQDCLFTATVVLQKQVSQMYPTISVAVLEGPTRCHDDWVTDWLDKNLIAMRASYLTLSKCEPFDKLKHRAILAYNFLAEGVRREDEQVQVVQEILDKGNHASVLKKRRGFLTGFANTIRQFTAATGDRSQVPKAEADKMGDLAFLNWLFDAKQINPAFTLVEDAIGPIVLPWFAEQISKCAKEAARILVNFRLDDLLASIAAPFNRKASTLQSKFIKDVEAALNKDTASDPAYIRLGSVGMQNSGSSYGALRLSGWRINQEAPHIRFTIFPLNLTQADEQALHLSVNHLPTPRVQTQHAQSFFLAPNETLRYIHRLGASLYLVVVDDDDHCSFYVEELVNLDHAISRGQYKKRIFYSRFSKDFVMAFAEAKRLLAVCGTTSNNPPQLQVQVYVVDEAFTSMIARGSEIQLTRWYDGMPALRSLFFVTGTEELCLIERSGRARILSLITQQFRPASLQLDHSSLDFYSTPDGSCLLAIIPSDDGGHQLAAYHWSSFGANKEGIRIAIPSVSSDVTFGVTSLGTRLAIHLFALSPSVNSVQSVILQIRRKSSEFQFKELGMRVPEKDQIDPTNNCLIDCHLDVWTRFPVQAAIQRENISHIGRCRQSITFLTDDPEAPFAAYFDRLIRSFQDHVHKPTGGVLSDIKVSALRHADFSFQDLAVSLFSAGEWIVELLCLIPLHLAVTRQNRFIPLKDGVWSPEYERELLGADVGQIVDALSLGWYESLFQSYMVSMPVRVVSSMGEQSVGKSYSLNHFVDTSFAGSAMRTTEGVWMSVTPTHDALVVALDFEGVHSIERSPQEDALLVLFNTAISNLVMFRNNFALSRNISGLFTSFQSSSSILDPVSNPGIFNGTLCIIIRDVVDTDAPDIINEFSLKFRKIVADEKEGNFISRLHRGRISIIPWPVINTHRFFNLFGSLKKQFERQDVTYTSAGVFLHTLKTLMAKLKANDWGALDQTLASHRARALTSSLRGALSRGLMEPDCEPLKDIDSDTEIPHHDSGVTFFVPDPDTDQESNSQHREEALRALISYCEQHLPHRFSVADANWIEALTHHLSGLIETRIALVRDWISANTSRFKDFDDVQRLRRTADIAYLDVSAAVQVCSMECLNCSLACTRPKNHPLDHTCGTSHKCWRQCEITEQHSSPQDCGLPAGHTGRHMCDISAHSCGKSCSLEGKRGCMHSCSLPVDHSESMHMCSARIHLCGQPCSLQNASTALGAPYMCSGRCTLQWDEPHELHSCEKVQSCPISCKLCARLCSTPDHFHGLEYDAVHLCGQSHACTHLCELPGICYIETQPSEIMEEFEGTHESFQFTKYTQVSRRLACAMPISPGSTSHTGTHKHGEDDNPFHFCEERCGQCEYFCTLPIGHSQNLHDTRHGSMTAARWLVDSPDNVVELDGHRFGSGDNGAPMLCNLICTSQEHHVHVDFCRNAAGQTCEGAEVQHITTARMQPSPDREKDWISHRLHWARLGFKDPYSREEQAEFAKCDSMCGGPEHAATASHSFCTQNIFHTPLALGTVPDNALGYVSHDGHSYDCKDPALLHQSFHVIFVIDSSGSMTYNDHRPLPNTPSSTLIRQRADNRYGAALSSLYSFLAARQSVVQSAAGARNDAYSVVTFSSSARTRVTDDFSSTPDQLLNLLLTQEEAGLTNFDAALKEAEQTMQSSFSSERAPVLIFLSDGECSVRDETVYDICRKAITLGKPLAFHTVSFGQDQSSSRLRRMARLAQEVYSTALQGQLASTATTSCSYTNAIGTIQLAETFLGIADSLTKTRASLIRG